MISLPSSLLIRTLLRPAEESWVAVLSHLYSRPALSQGNHCPAFEACYLHVLYIFITQLGTHK